MMKDLYNIL